MSDSVGFLGYDVGVDDKAVSDLMKQLEGVRKAAQAALDAKQAGGLDEALARTAKGANDTEKELTDAQKAVKLYAANVREAVALEKTGLATREATAKTLRGLTTEVQKQIGGLDKLGAEHRELAKAMGEAGGAAGKLEAAQERAQRAFDSNRVRQYADAQNLLRTELERGAIETGEFIAKTQALQNEMVDARGDFVALSKEVGQLDRVIGTTARGIQTAEGRFSKLGLSQQVAIGNTRKLGDGFNGLQGAIGPLLGGVGLIGLVKATQNFVGESQRANSAAVIFDKAIARSGQSATEADALVEGLSDTFGVLPSVVETAAAPILRAGGSIDDVGNALRGAGASAAAGGRDIANAMTNIGAAVATGRSELTEQADIMVNSSDAYKDYAENIGVSVDALTEQQKVQAFSNAIAEETRYELEDLDSVLTEQVKTQQDFRSAMAEARQELGEKFAPTLTAGATAATSLLGGFTGLPDTMQSSVLGIGGVTAGVTVLTGGMVALRAAMLPLFAPPAGLIIAGVAAVAALGTGLYQFAKATGEASDGTALLAETQTALANDDYVTHLTTATTAAEQLRDATGKEGLTQALTTYADTLGTEGKAALQTFIAGTLTATLSQGEYQKAVDLSIEKLLELEVAARRAETEQNYSLINQNQVMLESLKRQITDAEAALINYTSGFGSELRKSLPGYEERMQPYLEAVAGLKSNFDNLSESTDLLRRENEQVNTSYVRLLEIQAEYQDGTLTAEEATSQLLGSLGDSAEAATAFAAGLGGAAEAAPVAASGVNAVGAAADGTATATGEAERRTRALTTAYDSLTPSLRAVVDAQLEFQRSMTGRTGLGDDVAALRAATRAQLEYQTSRVDGERLAAEARAESTRALADADALERRVFGERRVAQVENLQVQEDLAAAVAYYSREVESSYDPLEAQVELNERNIAVLTNSIQAQSEWNERLRISGKDVVKVTDGANDFSDSLSDLNELAASFPNPFEDDSITDGLEAAREEAELFGETFDETASTAELVREEMERLLEKGLNPQSPRLQGLAEQYADLTAELEAVAKANENYADNLETTRDAQEALGDAAGLSLTEIDDLIAGLEEAALGTGALGEEARQAQADLQTLSVAREIGGYLDLMGDAARIALEGIPNLSQEAQAALGAFQGAAEEATAALADGAIDTEDGLNIATGAVKGLADALRDDATPETLFFLDSLEGAISGAAAGFAVGGPLGAAVGAAVGLIGGMIEGFVNSGAAAERAAEEAKAAWEETNRVLEENVALSEKTRDISRGQAANLNQAELDRALGTGQVNEDEAALAQITIDLQEASDDYRDVIQGIEGQRQALAQQLADNEITQADYDAQIAQLNTSQGQALDVYGYAVDGYLRTAEDLADKLGLSNEELYTAILTGNEEILGAMSPEERFRLLEGLNAYIQVFGEFPPGMEGAAAELGYSFDPVTGAILDGTGQVVSATATGGTATRTAVDGLITQLTQMFGPNAQPVIDAINALYTEQSAALTTGDQTLATTAAGSDAGRAAVDGLITDLQAVFGERAGPIIDLINQTYADMGVAVTTGGTTLSTQATGSTTLVRPAVEGALTAPGEGALTGSALSVTSLQTAFNALSGELGTQSTTLSTAQGNIKTTLSSGFSGLFGGLTQSVTDNAPGATTALGNALGGLETTSGQDSKTLAEQLLLDQIKLVELQKELFYQQQIMAGKYGPEAEAELKAQINAERAALLAGIGRDGGDGLLGALGAGTTSVTGALETFFSGQRGVIGTEAGLTVTKIGNAAFNIREAMKGLVGASTGGAAAGGRSPGNGGGSGNGRGAFGLFAPLNAMFDDRALGGMSDGFGDFDTFSLANEIEQRPFGLGSSMSREAEVEHQPPGGGAIRYVSSLARQLAAIRQDVGGYSRGVVGAVNAAIRTNDRAFEALRQSAAGSGKKKSKRKTKPLSDEEKQRLEERRKLYEENRDEIFAFQRDTFDFISGGALLGLQERRGKEEGLSGLISKLFNRNVDLEVGFTKSEREVFDFAKATGLALEQNVSGGIKAGLKDAIKSGEALDFQSTLSGLFDTTFDGLFDQLSKQVLAQSLGPLLTDLTADITNGDVTGAAKNVNQIADRLPGVFAKLEQVLAPLRGAADRLGFGSTNTAEVENLAQGIRLEARSLGASTPDWFTRMGSYFESFGRYTELQGRAADLQFRAAELNYKAATVRAAGALETQSPKRLVKL